MIQMWLSLDGTIHAGDQQVGDVRILDKPDDSPFYTYSFEDNSWHRDYHLEALDIRLTPLQFTKSLKAINIYTQAMAAIANNQDALDAYNRATFFDRSNDLLNELAISLGVTSDQLDQMFISGAALL